MSAVGQAMPPFVIFDAAKMLNHDWMIGEESGTRYGLSDTGWVDTYLLKSGSRKIYWRVQLPVDHLF